MPIFLYTYPPHIMLYNQTWTYTCTKLYDESVVIKIIRYFIIIIEDACHYSDIIINKVKALADIFQQFCSVPTVQSWF